MGKASSSGKVKETADNCRSVAKARVVDVLSEGPILGFVDSDGRELANALLAPTVVAGVITRIDVIEGHNYRLWNDYVQNNSNDTLIGSIPCTITSTDGQGSGAVATLKIYVGDDTETQHGGDLLGVTVVNGGTGYTNNGTVLVTVPPIIGRAIFFNDIPLQTGTYNGEKPVFNFNDVNLAFTPGVGDNVLAMPGFEATESIVAQQGTELLFGIPQTFQFYGDYDALNIGIRVGALYSQDINAARIDGSTVQLKIEYQYSKDGSSYTTIPWPWPLQSTSQGAGQGLHNITGKASSSFIYNISGSLNRDTTAKLSAWRITITRMTEQPETQWIKNDVYIDTATAIQYENYSYPYSARVGMELNAEQFTSIPTRSYLIKGLKVQIPTNYFPAGTLWELRDVVVGGKIVTKYMPTRNGKYTRNVISGEKDENDAEQIWDGLFYTDWTNNPAWCFYDILTNKRYGLGNYIYDVDKWSLYLAARYCDELVDDGYGGYEPRFTCNCYLQTREAAYKVLQDLASVFVSMPFWYGGTIAVSQDRPGDALREFNSANVKNGVFTYSGTSMKARHSSVLVSYNEPNMNYKLFTEYVEDIDTLLKCGIRQLELTAFACTSRGQAVRLAKRTLLTEKYCSRVISFTTGAEGLTLQPGQLVTIRDNQQSTQYGGRIIGYTNVGGVTTITLDRTIPVTEWDVSADFPLYFTFVKPQFFLDQATINAVFEPTNLTVRDTATETTERNDAINTATGGKLATITTAAQMEQAIEYLQAQYTTTVTIAYTDKTSGYAAFSVDSEGRTVITLQDAHFTNLPLTGITVNAVWGFTNANITPHTYRILTIEEKSPVEVDVTGVYYAADLYTEADDVHFETRPVRPNTAQWVKTNNVKSISVDYITTYLTGQTRYLVSIAWEAPTDSFVKDYELYIAEVDANNLIVAESQRVFTTSSTSATWQTMIPGNYRAWVVARSAFGGKSTPTYSDFTITSATELADERIYGLEIERQGNLATFDTPHVRIMWKENSSFNIFEFGNESDSVGASDGVRSPDFKAYQVRVKDASGNILMEKETVYPYFMLTGDDNMNLPGGPYATFTFEVKTLLHSTRNSVGSSLTVTRKALTI